jgi:hypothetical protein
MCREIIDRGEMELWNQYHQAVVDKLLNNPHWQDEAKKYCSKQPLSKWWDLMNSSDIEQTIDMM